MKTDAIIDAGVALAELGRTVEALSKFHSAAYLSTSHGAPDYNAYRNAGHALSELDRPTEAAWSYRRAASIAPSADGLLDDLSDAHLAVARERQMSGSGPAEVGVALEAAWALRPSSAELTRMLASVHHSTAEHFRSRGQWTEALEKYERSRSLLPSDANVPINEATALDALGREREAEESLHRAIRIGPRSALAYDNLGVMLMRHHRPQRDDEGEPGDDGPVGCGEGGPNQKALPCFRAALALAPSFGDAHYNLVSGLRRAARFAEASAVLRAAAAAAPRHAGVVTNRAFELIGSGAGPAQQGAELLAEAVRGGLWPGPAWHDGPHAARWQHPSELVSLHAETTHHVHAREAYECMLRPLEEAAAAMAAEAEALLPRFEEQTEGISTERTGWRELNLLPLCGGGASAEAARGVGASCAALDAMKSGAAASALQLRGASFSAIWPGVGLLPHCGPTNARLVVHMGLRARGNAGGRLRIGAPLVLAWCRGRWCNPEAHGTHGAAAATAAVERPPADDEAAEVGAAVGSTVELAWHDGRAFVWDDSFAHEVLPAPRHPDRPEGPRIILLLTFKHPALSGGPICPAV